MRTGIFEMSMADYLAADGISQSGLKIFARSPAHYVHFKANPKPSTPDQVIGTIEHLAVFQEIFFFDSHWVKPLEYVNAKKEKKKWNANATEAKEWLAAHRDRPVISKDNYDAIIGMRDSITRHPAARLALANGKAEQSLFCEDPETGLQLKCRSDLLSGNAIVDLKKCQDASKTGFAKTVANFGYDLQAASNLFIANEVGMEKDGFVFVAVEDVEPFAVGVYQLDEASIAVGQSKFRRLLRAFADCKAADKWPAYSPNVEYLSLPEWSRRSEFFAADLAENPPAPALTVE